MLKEYYRKEVQEGILLKGLKHLVESYTKNIDANINKLVNSLKKYNE